MTETCGVSTTAYPDIMGFIGTVGGASVYTEVRLEEVAEMGYNPLGEPARGEICLRGKTNFACYYKNPQLTTESIRDGWFHTGHPKKTKQINKVKAEKVEKERKK